MSYNRAVFFEIVRDAPFAGALSQSQVDGMDAILSAWEAAPYSDDQRWLAYCLATTFHETSQEMQPIEEYGKGEGMSYGVPDKNGNVFYGRGYVQLTWADNYKRADTELGLEGDLSCYQHPDNALDMGIAAMIMFRGMTEGWFRSGETLDKYFNTDTDDPYGAREIINGDKSKVPSWSNGVPIGNLIAGYHDDFLEALTASWVEGPVPVPELATLRMTLDSDVPIRLVITRGANVVEVLV